MNKDVKIIHNTQMHYLPKVVSGSRLLQQAAETAAHAVSHS